MDPEKERRVRELTEEAAALHVLGTAIGHGIPLLASIKLVQGAWPRFGEAFKTIHDRVEEGDSFFNGFKGHEHLFQPFVPRLIDAGEETGDLDKMCALAGSIIFRLTELLWYGKEIKTDKVNEWIDYKIWHTLLNAGLPMSRSLDIMSLTSLRAPVWQTLADANKADKSLAIVIKEMDKEFHRPQALANGFQSYNILESIERSADWVEDEIFAGVPHYTKKSKY